jgi:hypothetical protein
VDVLNRLDEVALAENEIDVVRLLDLNCDKLHGETPMAPC